MDPLGYFHVALHCLYLRPLQLLMMSNRKPNPRGGQEQQDFAIPKPSQTGAFPAA